ncbi:unnamed protein product, partial [Polarella glacialis]
FVDSVGEGNYGVVQRWRPLQNASGSKESEVAVKQIKWKYVGRSCFRQKDRETSIRNELRMLLVLDNPFIIKFREWFEHPWLGIFFVMELCTGQTLQDLLDEVCLRPSLADRQAEMLALRRYFREIVYAVAYIHNLDPPVIHRDLKPDNVIMATSDKHSCIKLIDFGLASLKSSDQEDGDYQQGTPVFMAPEQYVNVAGEYTEEMDIWALGVILTWILSAVELGSLQHPMLDLESGKGFDVQWIDLYRAYKEEGPWNRDLTRPGPCSQILDQVLVHNPADRARANDILQADWVRVDDPAAAACATLLRKGALLANMSTYAQLSRFDKKILSLVADHAAETKVVMLRQTFRCFDTSMTGRISCDELLQGFRRNDVDISEEDVQDIFEAIDKDNTGAISYNEWIAATIGCESLRSEKAIHAAFRNLDPTGKGSIDAEDLKRALGHAGAQEVFEDEASPISSPESKIRGGEHITFEQFRDMVHKTSRRRFAPMKTVLDFKVLNLSLPTDCLREPS